MRAPLSSPLSRGVGRHLDALRQLFRGQELAGVAAQFPNVHLYDIAGLVEEIYTGGYRTFGGIELSVDFLTGGLFHANHASNYLPIRARFPKEKEATLQLIDDALQGKIPLKPEYLRAL